MIDLFLLFYVARRVCFLLYLLLISDKSFQYLEDRSAIVLFSSYLTPTTNLKTLLYYRFLDDALQPTCTRCNLYISKELVTQNPQRPQYFRRVDAAPLVWSTRNAAQSVEAFFKRNRRPDPNRWWNRQAGWTHWSSYPRSMPQFSNYTHYDRFVDQAWRYRTWADCPLPNRCCRSRFPLSGNAGRVTKI